MSIEWLWALIASLILLVIASGLKINELSVLLNSLKEKITDVRAELAMRNDKHNVEISDSKQFYTTRIDKIIETHQKEIENLNRQLRLKQLEMDIPNYNPKLPKIIQG